jgi:hypothetical protein
MALNKPEKNMWAIKAAVGSLFKAVTLSTDPGQVLSFSSSLINTSRAYLIQKLEDKVPESEAIPKAMTAILHATVSNWKGNKLTSEGIQTIDERIDKIFGNSPSMAKYGLEIYRDVLFCDDLQKRWKTANTTYIQSPAAWAFSNAQLAEINMQLMEIIVRHDLMVFPKGEVFNMDDIGSHMGNIMRRAGVGKGQEEMRE